MYCCFCLWRLDSLISPGILAWPRLLKQVFAAKNDLLPATAILSFVYELIPSRSSASCHSSRPMGGTSKNIKRIDFPAISLTTFVMVLDYFNWRLPLSTLKLWIFIIIPMLIWSLFHASSDHFFMPHLITFSCPSYRSVTISSYCLHIVSIHSFFTHSYIQYLLFWEQSSCKDLVFASLLKSTTIVHHFIIDRYIILLFHCICAIW